MQGLKKERDSGGSKRFTMSRSRGVALKTKVKKEMIEQVQDNRQCYMSGK